MTTNVPVPSDEPAMKQQSNSDLASTSILLLLSLGLLALGVLVGTLVAMSATSLAQGVIAALFALFGGSLLGFVQKLSTNNQAKVASGILAISVGTLIGLYSGIYVNQYQLLTPATLRRTTVADKNAPYLRANELAQSDLIDQQYRNKGLTAEQAYRQLRALLNANTK